MSRILVPSPGAGNNPTYIVSDTEPGQGLLLTVTAQLLTSAVAGDRSPRLVVTGKSGSLIAVYPAFGVAHTNNINVSYTWGGAGTNYGDVTVGFEAVPMSSLFLDGGDQIQILTNNLDSGDLWSDMLLNVS